MDVKGYEKYLSIDLVGNLWSKRRNKYLKQQLDKDGYKVVVILIKGKMKALKVHRLMGLTYLPNIFNKPVIDHKNRIKGDNRLINLRWVTITENNINSTVRKINNTGYKNINYRTVNKKKYFNLQIQRNNQQIVRKMYSCNKWTIEQVVKIRDDYLKELDISDNITLAHHITTLNRTTPRPINPRKTDSEKSTST